MNKSTILALGICLYAGYTHGMDNELPTIASQENKQESIEKLIQETSVPNTSEINDNYDVTYTQQTKEQILQGQINKRKLCNVLYGITTLAMMGADIANSYWDEKGLLMQKDDHDFAACACPNRTLSCDIKTSYWTKARCEPRFDSLLLYGVNDGMAIYRLYAGFANLYSLYQVQHALNEQSVTSSTQQTSAVWNFIQGCSAGIIGTIASVAGIADGIKNYPRTVAIWSVNAAVDAIGALNWHQNVIACQELMKQDASNGDDATQEYEKV